MISNVVVYGELIAFMDVEINDGVISSTSSTVWYSRFENWRKCEPLQRVFCFELLEKLGGYVVNGHHSQVSVQK